MILVAPSIFRLLLFSFVGAPLFAARISVGGAAAVQRIIVVRQSGELGANVDILRQHVCSHCYILALFHCLSFLPPPVSL